MTAKAGSSWRSKGKSSRKRVLNRAVMVSAARKKKTRVSQEQIDAVQSVMEVQALKY